MLVQAFEIFSPRVVSFHPSKGRELGVDQCSKLLQCHLKSLQRKQVVSAIQMFDRTQLQDDRLVEGRLILGRAKVSLDLMLVFEG